MLSLTKREQEVYKLIVEGLSNREIAERLFVTDKAIKFHCTNIYKKLRVRSRTQLIVLALKTLPSGGV